MLLAARYFRVPRWETGWGRRMSDGVRIVKSLDSRLIDDGLFLYARSVNVRQLDLRFPWLVQDVAPGEYDATIVFINGQCFGFRFVTPRDGTCEDWRKTINTDRCHWVAWPVPKQVATGTLAFMCEAGLKFGRLDLIVGDDTCWFLEVNPNGQYGWLDDDERRLHRHVLQSLFDPAASIA